MIHHFTEEYSSLKNQLRGKDHDSALGPHEGREVGTAREQALREYEAPVTAMTSPRHLVAELP